MCQNPFSHCGPRFKYRRYRCPFCTRCTFFTRPDPKLSEVKIVPPWMRGVPRASARPWPPLSYEAVPSRCDSGPVAAAAAGAAPALHRGRWRASTGRPVSSAACAVRRSRCGFDHGQHVKAYGSLTAVLTGHRDSTKLVEGTKCILYDSI